MTLPSLRKRRTTQPNTLLSKDKAHSAEFANWRQWCAACLLSALAVPVAFGADSPLERLKGRSAADRWQEVSGRIGFSDSGEQAGAPPAKKLSPDGKPAAVAGSAETGKAGTERPDTAVPSWKSPEHVQRLFPIDSDLPEYVPSADRQATPTMLKLVPGPYEMTAQAPIAPRPGLTTSPNDYSPPATSSIPPEPDPVADRIAPQIDELQAERDLVFRPITQIQPYYAYSPTGKRPGEYLCPQPSSISERERVRCPEIRPLPTAGSTDRYFPLMNYSWVASNLHHMPLYFEDVPLERYGHRFPYVVQSFVSLGRFGVQLVGIPYQMALDPVCEDVYVLGYYRPGDVAPELFYQIPINLKAAAAAGGVYAGLIFLIP